MRSTRPRLLRCLLAACVLMLAFGGRGPDAHEIPSDVTLHVIARPAGDHLELLVRAPLEAMQDIEFPTFGAGYLDVDEAGPALENAAERWLAAQIEVFANGERLERPRVVAARSSIPSNRSFESYASARAHVLGEPLPDSTRLVWRQALLDTLLEVPLDDPSAKLALRPAYERLGLRVTTVLRFEADDGRVRMFRLDDGGERVALDPRWHQAAWRFVAEGFEHILDGADHLLFLFCLVLPFRGDLRALVWIVTAFTAAHSLTLIGSAYGLAPAALWFSPLIETLIAGSIFYMAVENVVAPELKRRWTIAFAFGLVHGFGFAFALTDTLQFAGEHVLMSLLSFNLGVELGQLLVIVLLVPVLNLIFRYVMAERIGVIVLSVIVAHTAWHWTTERFAVLRAYPLGWRELGAAFGL